MSGRSTSRVVRAGRRFKPIHPVFGFVGFKTSELDFLTNQSSEFGFVFDNKHGRRRADRMYPIVNPLHGSHLWRSPAN